MITTADLRKKFKDLELESRDLTSLARDLNTQLKDLNKQYKDFCYTIHNKPWVVEFLEPKEEKERDSLIEQQKSVEKQLKFVESRKEEINHIYENLYEIRCGSSVFSTELIMPKIAKLISAFEKKDYRYYAVTRVIQEEDSAKTKEIVEHFFSTSKKVVSFYPLNYFDIFKDGDDSMIELGDGDHCGNIAFHSFYSTTHHSFFHRFIMSDNSTDYVIENESGTKVSGNYIKDFIDKVIDYRLTKMYPSSILEETTTWREICENKEGEDITSEEIDVILADFIINYKKEFKEKTKYEKFLVKNNYSLFPKKKQ